jgi:hypothetical protein
MMLIIYAYFYSLVEDSESGVNAFRVWREHFPEEEEAIAGVEALVIPLRDNLRLFRNRLGFHGSRSRAHEARGFELFGANTGTELIEIINLFKGLGAMLLHKDLAAQKSDVGGVNHAREHLDIIARHARRRSGG